METKAVQMRYVAHDANYIDGVREEKMPRNFATYEQAAEYTRSLIADAEKYWKKQGVFHVYDSNDFDSYVEGDIIKEETSADGANCVFYPFGDNYNKEEIYIDTAVEM